MADHKELDPYSGAIRWAYMRVRFDHLKGVLVGGLGFPVVAAVLIAIIGPK